MKIANDATSTLAAAITSGATSLSIQAGDAAKFPTLGAGESFPLTLIDGAGNKEICKVTARAGSALTVVRGAEGTVARAFTIGDKAELRLTAAVLEDKVEASVVAAALAGKSNVGHTHAIADVVDLQTTLNSKANAADIVGGVPAGAVMFFWMSAAPSGWIKANGAAVSRTTYAVLWEAMGSPNTGNGTTTFTLPDLRSEFVRGIDDGRGVDTGRVLGSAQASQNLAHNHTGLTNSDTHTHSATTSSAGLHAHTVKGLAAVASNPYGVTSPSSSGNSGATVSTTSDGAHVHAVTVDSDTHNHTIASDGGTEARPRNIALLACIKY